MKKHILVSLVIFSILVVIISCSENKTCTVTVKDGVKTFRNKNIPSVQDLNFNPVKKFTIKNDSLVENYISFFDLDVIGTDSQNNIFIADLGNSPKVNKYDNEGNFVKTFVKRGQGPGEVQHVNFLCVSNDTIYIGDRFDASISKFTNEGEFIEDIHPGFYAFQVNRVGENKYISAMLSEERHEGKLMYRIKWALLNNSFKPKKVLFEKLIDPEKSTIPDEWSYIASSKDRVFVGVNDKENYRINVYDHNGILIEEIFKDYIQIKFNEVEIDKMAEYLNSSGQRSLDRKQINKKRAVMGVYFDKNDNLIVHPAVDISKVSSDGIVLDFFKNNIYQNSTIIKTEHPYYQCEFSIFLKFLNDRFYLVDSERNVLEVYEY